MKLHLHPRLVQKVPDKVVRLMFAIETIIIIVFTIYLVRTVNITQVGTAGAQVDSSSIDIEIVKCKSLPPKDRTTCAQRVGAMITVIFPDKDDQISQCLKLRPALVKACQDGLFLPKPTTTP